MSEPTSGFGSRALKSGSAASVPIPKFARTCGTLACELRNQRDTSNSMIQCPFEPEVRNRSCSTMCANFGFGALASLRHFPDGLWQRALLSLAAALVCRWQPDQHAVPYRPAPLRLHIRIEAVGQASASPPSALAYFPYKMYILRSTTHSLSQSRGRAAVHPAATLRRRGGPTTGVQHGRCTHPHEAAQNCRRSRHQAAQPVRGFRLRNSSHLLDHELGRPTAFQLSGHAPEQAVHRQSDSY